MKSIKITLAIAVIAIIGVFTLKWFIKLDDPGIVKPPINQYTSRIENEINSIKNASETSFSSKEYNDIKYRINDYSDQGFLGKSASDNLQWKEILSKNLYSVYSPKFVNQAIHIFKGSEWRSSDLDFIRSEVQKLKSSFYLGSTGLVSNLNEINNILAKFDEINKFINTCNGYTYSDYGMNSNYPEDESRLIKSRTYLTNNLDNTYVNNCSHLKDGLRAVPKFLFIKHINYLTNKINAHGGRYDELYNQRDYSSNIYSPLKSEIDALDNNIYKISDTEFDDGFAKAIDLLSEYNIAAYNYYKKN